MPKDNIDRAIARGAGSEKGEELEEITYEGYGPHGIAIMIESMTDNRNRTVSEIRHALTKSGGNMASAGAVAWQFDRKGQIVVMENGLDQDELFLLAVEAGAEDVVFNDDDTVEIITVDTDLASVRDSLSDAGHGTGKCGADFGRAERNRSPTQRCRQRHGPVGTSGRPGRCTASLLESSHQRRTCQPTGSRVSEDSSVVIGIDPGTAITGFGVLAVTGGDMRAIEYGVIRTPSTDPLQQRLLSLYDELTHPLCSLSASGHRRRRTILRQERAYSPDGRAWPRRRPSGRGAVGRTFRPI